MYNGPKAPLKPKMELIISNEVCDYVRAVMEAETADHAINIWTPATTPAKKIKRLQTPAKTNRGKGSSGSRGRGGHRGGKRGGGRGGQTRGRGGYCGSSCGSYGPTFSGIHYHNW